AAATTTCAPLVSRIATVGPTTIHTTSTSFINVAGTAVNFTQGGSKPGCVVVLFSAEVNVAADENMRVQALLDNNVACTPSNVYFGASNATSIPFAAHAMNFICRR